MSLSRFNAIGKALLNQLLYRKEKEMSLLYAVYVILGYDVDGQKDILGLWLSESESKHQWVQIFDELKNRGWKMFCFFLWMA